MQQWRKIYTNLFDNDELGVLGFLVRYLYIGTIVFSDDLGRFKANSKWLRAKIFPYDDITEDQIAHFLQKLVEKNKIKLYEVQGEPYGQHLKWLKYNKPRKDRKQAINPPPPKTTNGQPDDNQASTNGQPNHTPEEKRREEKREEENSKLALAENLNSIIDKFKSINPAYKKFFADKTQRAALTSIIREKGIEQIVRVIEILPQTNTMPYAPTITSPYQLEKKYADLEAFCIKEKNKIKKSPYSPEDRGY